MIPNLVKRGGTAGLVLALGAMAAIAQITGSLRDFLIEYRCPVVDRLERIYEAGDPTSQRNRFLAVTNPGHPHGYVQCMFVENRTKILCEASSGFYFDPAGATRSFRLSLEAIAALGRLGFSTDDSEGNFQTLFDIAAPPDFNVLADLILKALHDAYGARAETNLEFNAPFAPRPTTTCLPVS